MKNKNQLDEMVDIFTALHQYVPIHEVQGTTTTTGTGTQEDEPATIEMLLFGGDLLTTICAKGTQ